MEKKSQIWLPFLGMTLKCSHSRNQGGFYYLRHEVIFFIPGFVDACLSVSTVTRKMSHVLIRKLVGIMVVEGGKLFGSGVQFYAIATLSMTKPD